MEFDTSHFRLADLKGAQGVRALVPKRIVPRGMEAPELPQSPGNPGKAGTRNALKQASNAAAKPMGAAPVAVRQTPGSPKPAAPPPPVARAMAAPFPRTAPRPDAIDAPAPHPGPLAAKVESDFDPNSTAVDFRTLGELVHQQDLAQSLFETKLVPDEAPVIEDPVADAHAAERSSWGAKELVPAAEGGPPDLAAKLKAKARATTPPPLPLPPEKSWLPTAVAIAGALALAVALVWYLLAD